MLQKNLSSGDLIADRRADYARGLAGACAFAEAAEVMRQALERAPAWAAGWFTLGTYLEKADSREPAGAAYREVLKLTDSDIFGAGLKLAALGLAVVPPAPPAAFVERLFDDYAERFDKALVERLAYAVPAQLSAMLRQVRGADGPFAHAVDLGCGTGLMGERLRADVSYLEGYDLSAGMLAKAAGKGLYDQLGLYDLSLASHSQTLRLTGSAPVDLVTAADVLIYLGDLAGVFALAAAMLAPGGLFALSVEKGAPDGDYMLQTSLRYAHGAGYVGRLSDQAGFDLAACRAMPIRRDGAAAIDGLLYVLRRRPLQPAVGDATLPAVIQGPNGRPLELH